MSAVWNHSTDVLRAHKAPIPEEEPLPGEDPVPEEEPAPHPDPVVRRPTPVSDDVTA